MVNNQVDFNNEYSKEEIEEIKIEDEEFEENHLIIENYSELKNLSLSDNEGIEKIILRNLEKLEKCKIWKCGIKELVIENCPNIKSLNIENNSLANLDFLAVLANLEELKIEGNNQLNELIETLKEYRGNWKLYQKFLNLQKENQESKEKYQDFKKFVKDEVLDPLSGSIEKVERRSSVSKPGNTDELMKITKEDIEKVKVIKEGLENELSEVKTEFQQLEIKLKEEQKNKFSEQESQINYLEIRINELVHLIKNQKQKIIEDFLNVLPEPKLIKKLITSYLEFKKSDKQNADNSLDLEDNYNETKKELRKKLGTEFVKKLQPILSDCESLVNWELELEERLTKKTLYLEQQKETVKQIAYNKEENQKIIEIHEATHRRQVQKSNTVLQMELVKVTTKLEAKEEENQRLWEKANHPTYQTNNTVIGDGNTLSNQIIYQIQINQQFLQAELTNLKKDYQQTIESNSIPSNANQIKKTILFFTAKRMLANTRQETINKLIQTYQIATKSIQKYDKVTLVGNYLSYGEELAGAIPFGSTAVKIFSKGLPVIANLLKNNSLKQKANKFEEHLIEDERALTLLQATYQSLNNSLNQPSKINSLINNFLKSSNNELSKHGVFEVAKLEKNSSLKEENMTQAIELLTNHLKEFNQSLQSETKTCLEQLENLFASEHGQQLQGEIEKLLNKLIGKEKPEEEIANISSEKQILELEEKITTQKTQLENLINSIKDKLESKKKFTSANEKAKITQQRHQLLEQFIEKGFIDSALQKITEEKKINLAEITTLQASLQKLQEQLTNCQLENQIVINRN